MGHALGDFEQLVLLALLRLGDDAYGVSIGNELAQRTGRDVSLGAVYTTLDRLERKGFVRHRLGSATPERGGRRKKHYALEPAGRRALESALEALRRMTEGLELSPGTLRG